MARLADTLQTNYGSGVVHPMDVPGVEARRTVTLLDRYGAKNVFCRESSIFDKVQASMDGKRPVLRGTDNPFAWTEVQEKIRRVNLERYGAENPQQVPDIREKTKSTNLSRYGGELLASPIIREKSESTNLARYGFKNPANSPEVVERARQTNLERWGVEWTSQNPEVQMKQEETQFGRYGGWYISSEEGRVRTRQVLIERYGVDHPAKIDGFWSRVTETFIHRYGVTHPFLLTEFLDRRRETCRKNLRG